jgi:hypothetical protein
MALGAPARPYLVYTSAGEHANIFQWLEGRRNFDLWITYYGDHGNRYRQVASFYNRRKGSKFQNLYYAFQHWRHLLAHYQAVLVMDDDLRITGSEISRLFEIREQLDLWVLQPAFSPWGKISHPITRVDRSSRIRYTNYVEVTCPLFRWDKLEAFLNIYDPVLVCYGIDWWFLENMGTTLEGNVAIVDEITCVNPYDSVKGGVREISRLQPFHQRVATWKQIQTQHAIGSEQRGMTEYRRVPRAPIEQMYGRLVVLPERAATWLRAQAARAESKGRRLVTKLRDSRI